MANETLIFGADDAEGNRNLWGYNPVTGNVAPVSLSNPGSSGGPPRYDLYDLNGKIIASYVTEDDIPQIGYFNGTEVEFIGSATQNNFDPELDNFIEYGGDLYFTLEPNGSDRAIVKYDPVAGTLTNITEGSLFEAGTQRLVVFDDGSGEKLYFDAEPNDGDLRTLYRWDGTTIEAAPNFSGTDEVMDMAFFNGAIYFSSTPLGKYDFNDYANTNTYDDNRLYKYDGASVTQVKDFSSEVNVDPYIQEFTLFDNKLFFTATYFSNGTGGRVYSIDTAGTITTEYIAYSDASTSGTPGNLTIHNGELYFSVRLYNSGSETDIYKYNSTGSATNLTSGIAGYSDSDLKNLMSFEDGLIYQQDAGQGDELQYLNLLNNTVTQLTDINDTGDSLQNNSADSPFIVYQGNIAPLVNAMDKTSLVSKNAGSVTVNPDLEVFEIDDNVIKSAQVSFASGFQAGDALAVTDMHGITSSFNASTGLLTLTGQASPEQYQAILRTLTFDPSSTAGERVLLLQATDSNDKISSSTAASGFYTFDVVDGDVSSFSYDSQPSGVPTESDGTYVGSFSITDANLGNVTYKVTEGGLSTDFASLTEAFDANNYGIQYNSASQSLEVQVDTDTYETPDYLAIKFDNAAHFYGFKANDPENYSYDKFIVTGFKNGAQVAQETFSFADSWGLGLNIKTSVAGFQSVDEIRINPDALDYPTETGFGTFFDDLIFVTSTPVPTVSIALAGGANANDASVDFVATFSESVSNVSTDDFELTFTGSASGSIASVSGSGTNYTVTVNNLSGDGTARLDLKDGSDIVNGDGGTPGAYTSGGTHALDLVVPTVSTGNITLSGATGTNGEFIVGDTVTVQWDNSASGDNNGDITAVTVDFSELGGGSAVSASLSGGTYTATYTITSGNLDASDRNVIVNATDDAGNQGNGNSGDVSLDNELPGTPSASGALEILENATASTSVGSATASAGDGLSFSLTDNAGGRFNIDSSTGEITYAGGGLDHETTPTLSVEVTTTDNAGNTAAQSLDITVQDVNEAPTVAPTAATGPFTEGGSDASLWSAHGIDTVDAGQTLLSVKLLVAGVVDGSAEQLAGGGLSAPIDLVVGSQNLTLNGQAVTVTTATSGSDLQVSLDASTVPLADWQSLIQSLTYRNTSDNPTAGNRQISVISVQDDGDTANSGVDTTTGTFGTRTVQVIAVNDAPVIGGLATTPQSSVVAGDGAQALTLFSGITLSDPDTTDFGGGTLTISQTAGTTNGSYALVSGTVNAGGDTNFTASDTISVGGVDIGTVTTDGASGASLVITFNSDATPARVATFIENLSYDAPSGVGDRDFRLTLVDGDGTPNGGDDTVQQDFTVQVSSNPPVIANLDGDTASHTEDGGPVNVDAGTLATVTDADNTDFDGGILTISVTGNAVAGEDLLSLDTSGTVALAGTTAGATVSVGGTQVGTLANTIAAGSNLVVNLTAPGAIPSAVQALVNAVTYDNTSDDPDENPRTLTITLTDTATNAGQATVTTTVNVAGVNDAPTATGLPMSYTFTEDTAGPLDLAGFTVDDVDLDAGTLTLTVEATSGDISAVASDGVAVSQVDSKTVTLKGTEAQLNAFLANNPSQLTYTPPQDLAGANVDSVTYTLSDQEADVTLGTLPINIMQVNDTPTIAVNNGPSVRTGNTITLSDTHLNEGDPDDDGADLTYTLDSLPSSGILSLDGTALAVSDTFTQQDINDGRVTFKAGSSAGDVSFDITLADGGENGAGAVSDTVTVTVTPPPPPTPTPDPEPEPEPDTIDGAPATVTDSVDPDTGNPITRFEIQPVTDGSRVDEDSATDDVDVNLSDRIRASISDNLGLIATRRSDSSRDDLRIIINRQEDEGDTDGPNSREVDDFLQGVSGASDIVTVTPTRPGNLRGDDRVTVRIDPPEGDDSAPVVIVDSRQLDTGDSTPIFNITGAGSIVIRGSGTFRGAEELEEGGAPDVDNVLGDNSAQTLFFGPGDDIIRGSGGDDVVGSAGGDDRLFGNSGNDTLYGGEGNDLMHGGLGQDVILVEGNRDDYVITHDHGIVTLQQVGGNDVDTLINVEALQFDDQDMTLTYSNELSWITTLYDRLLDRQGDLDGVQYWADRLEGSGSFDEIIAGFLNAQEFTSSLGQSISTLNTGAQVDVLYQTLLQRDAEPDGHAYWTDRLDSGVSLDAVATGIALSDEAAGQYLDSEAWEFIL